MKLADGVGEAAEDLCAGRPLGGSAVMTSCLGLFRKCFVDVTKCSVAGSRKLLLDHFNPSVSYFSCFSANLPEPHGCGRCGFANLNEKLLFNG